MFHVEDVVKQYMPKLAKGSSSYRLLVFFLRRLFREKEFHEFERRYPHLQGMELIEQAFEYFNFSYLVSPGDLENIPTRGKVIIVANHPIGSLDGLAMIKLVRGVRPDVRIVSNEVLTAIKPLRSLFLPVNNMYGGTQKENLQNITRFLGEDGAVIFFPAGEVSRFTLKGIRDGRWRTGFVRMAHAARAPILPVYVRGRNTILFYIVSSLYKPLSTLFLVRELFMQRNKRIQMRIGEIVPFDNFGRQGIKNHQVARLFRRHLYRIARGRAGLFATQKAIAHPARRQELRAAMRDCQYLGQVEDGKKIYMHEYRENSPIMREIGRLREIAFRAVGEGTGSRLDLDRFDHHYLHLFIWDEDDIEIAGAYRLAETKKVIAERGLEGLYSATLFAYDERMHPYLDAAIELGRSFVQPRYWGRRSLDYLWYGIGAFLRHNTHIRYMMGPVSISNSLPEAARDLLIHFYKIYFSPETPIASSRNPYALQQDNRELFASFKGDDYRADFRQLKLLLANMGVSVPTLYKQYSELCEMGGVKFLDFGIDPDFADCLDGLALVDTAMLKESKRQRYITRSVVNAQAGE
jgi:putative hemolysin